MIRGTTPTIILKLSETIPFDTLYVTFTKLNQTVLEKTLDDVRVEGNKIYVPLTQEETLALDPKCPLNIQLRGKVEGQALASSICRIMVNDILKEGLI